MIVLTIVSDYALGCSKDPLEHWVPDAKDLDSFIAGKGCRKVNKGTACGENERRVAKSEPSQDPERYHMLRQESDGSWSAKLGDKQRVGSITNIERHSAAAYGNKPGLWKTQYWCCKKCPE